MSDTPRTDAHSWHDGDYDDPLHALSDFARQLERELNTATSEVERLRKANMQLREGTEEQKQRIKRLEEFARTIENDFDHDEDAHRYGTTCRVCDAEDLLKETKAKEAKP